MRRYLIFTALLRICLPAEAFSQVIPYDFDSLTSADAARPVEVSLDGDIAALIEPGASRFSFGTTNNVRTYCRTPGTTTWTEIDIGSELAYGIDVGGTNLAVGFAGRVDLWDFSFNASKPSSSFWTQQSTITFTNESETALALELKGDRLAVLIYREVYRFSDPQFVRLYSRSGTNWSQIKEFSVDLTDSSGTNQYADDFSFDGERLVIASKIAKTIHVYDRNLGGANNWGISAIIYNNPLGVEYPFFSVALAGNRLAASAADPATGQQVVLAYTNAGSWVYAGVLLTNAANTRGIYLGTDGSRIAAQSVPLSSPAATSDFWIFSSGTGPAGWVLERSGRSGPFSYSEYDYILGSGRRSSSELAKPSISTNSAMFGVADTNTLGDITGWAASLHTRSTGGSTNWGIEKSFQIEGTPGEFGSSVAMSQGFLVAGMPGENGNKGAAYVWSLADEGGRKAWYPVARLAKETPAAGDRFGASVAIYSAPSSFSATVAVGAPGEFTDKGAVYIYNVVPYLGQSSLPLVKALSPPFDTNSFFGASLDINDRFLVIGAPLSDISGANRGAVYIHEINTGGTNNWGVYRTNAAPSAGYGFGSKVSIDQGVICVTRPFTNGTGPAVFVYARNAGGTDNWGFFTNIPPPAGSPAGFGASVDNLSTYVFIGATGAPNGKAYAMFPEFSGAFTTLVEIAGTTNEGASFGSSIDYEDAVIAVGAPLAAGGGTARGRIKLYQFAHTNAFDWGSINGTENGEQLGTSLAGYMFHKVAGAPFSSTNGAQSGKVRTIRAGSYELWAGSQPGAFASQWLPSQDWDGDRSANLMEFAMGSDPMNAASVSNLVMEIIRVGSSAYAGWLMPSNPYDTYGLSYQMEDSLNLGSWAREGYTQSTSTPHRLFLMNTSNRMFRLAPRYPVYESESITPIYID